VLLITAVADFVQLVADQGEGYWVEQIQLVTPAHVNKRGLWLMEPLIEVSVVRDSP
jgi:hypothetical protein